MFHVSTLCLLIVTNQPLHAFLFFVSNRLENRGKEKQYIRKRRGDIKVMRVTIIYT